MCSPRMSTYPAAQGFNASDSDARAQTIADQTMRAMGGYENWQSTRFIHWNFFGSRTLLWDKHTGNVRIESQKDDFRAIVNVNKLKGQVMKDGMRVTQPDSLNKYLKRAHDIWINDSYWLVMPFKLKDSGVTLKYVEEQTDPSGNKLDVVSLTFNDVGVTPQNKYHVFIDQSTHLVSKWAFYPTVDTEDPRFETPWKNYEQHGNILLSGDRGGDYQLTDVWVKDEVDPKLFSEL